MFGSLNLKVGLNNSWDGNGVASGLSRLEGELSVQGMFWQRAAMRAWETFDTQVCNAISLDFAAVQINDMFVARSLRFSNSSGP